MPDRIADRAALDFVLTLRRRWADRLYPHLRDELDAHSAGGELPRDPRTLATRVHALPAYPWFAWLERGSQKMLWRAVGDSVAGVRRETPAARPGVAGPATVSLDASLRLPAWYTEWDIHLQPGGVWSDDTAALVYELGAKLVMLGENDDYRFHRLFVETAVPRRSYRRIVDLGCGFGKSTWPLKKAHPEADVIGVDLAAPCLRLAAERASAQGLEIHFRQADAAATGLEAQSADLVTSTMLLHETPVAELPKLLRESARLLAPGGVLRFLDFQLTGDPFRDLAMLEHGTRNNEPFMAPMMVHDLTAMAAEAGLANARWQAFDERSKGRLDELEWPPRRDWHFPWAVLEAEKRA
jgi:ubiquinone/menaquinone biosynthesis C-methylase UbiE